MSIQYGSIDTWPGKLRTSRSPAPFKRSTFSSTLDLLDREVRMVSAEGVLCRLAIGITDLTRDGRIRADARPSHPGVVLSFRKPIQRPTGETIKLPLNFPCDRFTHWQDNVRAIAIALEDLRRIDRYGVTQNSEQYSGFKALPPPGPSHEAVETVEDAARLMHKYSGGCGFAWGDLLTKPSAIVDCYRSAAKSIHPDADAGLNPELWSKLQAAKTLLDAHHSTAR